MKKEQKDKLMQFLIDDRLTYTRLIFEAKYLKNLDEAEYQDDVFMFNLWESAIQKLAGIPVSD